MNQLFTLCELCQTQVPTPEGAKVNEMTTLDRDLLIWVCKCCNTQLKSADAWLKLAGIRECHQVKR